MYRSIKLDEVAFPSAGDTPVQSPPPPPRQVNRAKPSQHIHFKGVFWLLVPFACKMITNLYQIRYEYIQSVSWNCSIFKGWINIWNDFEISIFKNYIISSLGNLFHKNNFCWTIWSIYLTFKHRKIWTLHPVLVFLKIRAIDEAVVSNICPKLTFKVVVIDIFVLFFT